MFEKSYTKSVEKIDENEKKRETENSTKINKNNS
jgi:hypothetical protein